MSYLVRDKLGAKHLVISSRHSPNSPGMGAILFVDAECGWTTSWEAYRKLEWGAEKWPWEGVWGEWCSGCRTQYVRRIREAIPSHRQIAAHWVQVSFAIAVLPEDAWNDAYVGERLVLDGKHVVTVKNRRPGLSRVSGCPEVGVVIGFEVG